MIQNFTPNDVLLSKSGELSSELDSLLKLSINEDPGLEEFSQDVELIEREINRTFRDPGEAMVMRIMAEVKSLKKNH
jgi:hypothetical protein